MADPDLDALRRRVYARDATEDDRSRYAAALQAPDRAEPAPSVVPVPAAPHAARRRRLPIAVVAGIAAAGVAASIVLAVAGQHHEPVTLHLHRLPTTADERAALVRLVGRGADDLPSSDFGAEFPVPDFGALSGTGHDAAVIAAVTTETGTGSRSRRLYLPSDVERADRTVVVLVTDRDALVTIRTQSRDDAPGTLWSGAEDARAGAPLSASARFRAGRGPAVLQVHTRRDVHWTAELFYFAPA